MSMRRIDRYADYIAEAALTEDEYYDVRQICSDLIDGGFELEASKKFMNSTGHSATDADTTFKIPFISIFLSRSTEGREVEEQRAVDFTSAVYECVAKLSELGESSVKKIEVSYYHKGVGLASLVQEKATIHVMLEEEADISEKQGFYEFARDLQSYFERTSNKVSRAYKVEIGNGFVTLKPKPAFQQPTFAAVKSFLKSKFDPVYWTTVYNRNYREYTYEAEKSGNDIKIDYKGFYTLRGRTREGGLTI